MKTKVHAFAGVVAFLCVLSFWASSIISELFGDAVMIAEVKGLILFGLAILLPAMVTVGATGASLGKRRKEALIEAKKKRMPIIAGVGILILIPAAFYLESKARLGAFDAAFYAVQGIELAAGALNLTLLGKNIRDGLKMTAKRRQQKLHG